MYQMFDRILSLRVNDVMSRGAVTVNASQSMCDVAHLFAKHNLHAAPVVDDSDQCVGIITASDFVRRCDQIDNCDGDPHDVVNREDGIQLEPRNYDYVNECMSHGVQSVTPSTPLVTAARVMTDAHLHVLPVVEDNRAVGVVSNLDVVSAMVKAFEEARNSV